MCTIAFLDTGEGMKTAPAMAAKCNVAQDNIPNILSKTIPTTKADCNASQDSVTTLSIKRPTGATVFDAYTKQLPATTNYATNEH